MSHNHHWVFDDAPPHPQGNMVCTECPARRAVLSTDLDDNGMPLESICSDPEYKRKRQLRREWEEKHPVAAMYINNGIPISITVARDSGWLDLQKELKR